MSIAAEAADASSDSTSDSSSDASIVPVVVGLLALDVARLDRDGVRAALGSLARVKGWHDGLHVRLSRRLGDLAVSSPSMFPEADIAKAAKSSQRDANQAARRVGILDAVPEMEGALGSGDVSAEHVDSLGRAMKRLQPEQRGQLAGDGERLVAIAKSTTPEEFDKVLSREVARLDRDEGGDRLGRQRRAARFRSWTDRDTGMVCFRGELDPDTGLKVVSRIDTVSDAMFHGGVPADCPDGDGKQDWLRAQAFTRLVLRRARPSTPERVAPDHSAAEDTTASKGADAEPHAEDIDIETLDNRCEMIVVIDLDTLIHGVHDKTIIDNGVGVDLPLESYRRMACMAAIIPVVLNSDGVCVDEGRAVRLATRNQRRALRAMYDTCAVPGCTVHSRHCQPHHIRWYIEHHGLTNLHNLIPLCSRHHHAVHEGGWNLVIHPDRSLTITYPDRSIQTTGPPARTRQAAA